MCISASGTFFYIALCPLCKFKHSWRRDFLRKWWWPPIECNEVISDQSFAAYVHKPWDLHGTQGYFIFLLIEIAHKQREIVFVTANVLYSKITIEKIKIRCPPGSHFSRAVHEQIQKKCKIKFVEIWLKLILAFLAFEFQRPGRQKIHKCQKKSIDGVSFSCGAPSSNRRQFLCG